MDSTSVKNEQGYTVTIPAPAAGVQNAPIVAPQAGTYGTGDSSKYNPVITGQGPGGNNQPVTKVVQKEIPDWSTMTDEQIEAALKGMAQAMESSRGTAGYDDALRSGSAEIKKRQEAAKKKAQQDALDKAVNKDKENQEMVKKATEGLSSLWQRFKNNMIGDYNNDGVVDDKDIAEKFKQDTSKPVIDDTKPGTLTPEIVNPTNNGQNVTTRTQLDNEVKNGSSDPFQNPQGIYEETKDNSEWFGGPQPEQTNQPENTSYRGPTDVQPPKEEEQPKEEETPWQYTGNTGGSVFRGNPYTIGSGSYFNDDNTVNQNTQSWFDSTDFSYFNEPPAKQNDGLDYKRQDLWNAQNTAPQNDTTTDGMTPPPDYTGIPTQNEGLLEGDSNVERPDNSSKTELEQAQDRGDQYREWSNQRNKLMREAQQSQKLAEARAKSSAQANLANLATPTTPSSTEATVPQSPADKQAEMIRKAQKAAAEARARASAQASRIQAQNLAHFSK